MAGRLRVAHHETVGVDVEMGIQSRLPAGRLRVFFYARIFFMPNSQPSGSRPDSHPFLDLIPQPFHGGLPSAVPPVGDSIGAYEPFRDTAGAAFSETELFPGRALAHKSRLRRARFPFRNRSEARPRIYGDPGTT